MSGPQGAAAPGEHAGAWTQIIRQLSVIHRDLRRQLAAAAKSIGASDTELLLLATLHADPAGLSQSQLATAVGLSAGQVSGLVESLRQRGWLEQLDGSRDRRRHTWRLSTLGSEQVQQGWHLLREHVAQWDRRLPAAQRAALVELLDQLQAALEPPSRQTVPTARGNSLRPAQSPHKEAA